MALIGSDMLRSTLELAYPIVTLTSGDVTADSLYCQIGGFFTAYFFEASDLMVFIIAIHTAVFVFNPKLTQAADEGGIWRWRYYIFAAWFVIPGLLAGLAFINPTAYVPLVTWCYLPAHPLVWRYTLAWGPRYFILLTISVLYIALYIYVRRVYRTIDRNQRGGTSESDFDSQGSSHGSSQFVELGSPNLQSPPPSYLQRKRPSIPSPLLEDPEKESRPSLSILSTETPTPTSETSIGHQNLLPEDRAPTAPPPTAVSARNVSAATTLTYVPPPSVCNPPASNRDINLTFNQRRARVERQLRTLFIFPIVYLIMWIPPFINHLYQVITFDSKATTLPPGTFVVTVLATIFLPAQGFVNVCVYAIRERPWRRRKRHDRSSTTLTHRSSFRPSAFVEWKGFHHNNNNNTAATAASVEKPTDVEMQAQLDVAKEIHMRMSDPVEAAYTRRDIEQWERELARAHTASVSSESRIRRDNWWDAQYEIENNV
jgi:G protein-coupled receptor GPR1